VKNRVFLSLYFYYTLYLTFTIPILLLREKLFSDSMIRNLRLDYNLRPLMSKNRDGTYIGTHGCRRTRVGCFTKLLGNLYSFYFFLIFINNILLSVLKYFQLLLFSDDPKLFSRTSTIEYCIILRNEFDLLDKWFQKLRENEFQYLYLNVTLRVFIKFITQSNIFILLII